MLRRLDNLAVQGKWHRWSSLAAQDLRWQSFFSGRINQPSLKWLLNATLDTLPTEANRVLWKYVSGSPCVLCKSPNPPTLAHVLNVCDSVEARNRWKFRHDSILACLDFHVSRHLDDLNAKRTTIPSGKVAFVREGTFVPERRGGGPAPSPPSDPFTRLLAMHHDWQLLIDLPGSPRAYYVVPPQIATYSKRPDLIITSETGKVALFIELTSPLPTGISAAEARKRLRYQDLEAACLPGWRPFLTTIEVSSLGYLGDSVIKLLHRLFMSKHQIQLAKRDIENVTRRASFHIFLARNSEEWKAPAYLQPPSSLEAQSEPTTQSTNASGSRNRG